MFHVHNGMFDAHHVTDLVDAIPRGIDDVFALNVAFICLHNPRVVGLLCEPYHVCIAVDFRAHFFCGVGESACETARVYVAVNGVPKPADESVYVE